MGEAFGVLAAAQEPIALAWSIPFILLLAAIAMMPFIHLHWWEKWYPAVAVGLGIIPACYYWFAAPSATRWLGGMEEYVSFIILLFSLFVVSGGIVIQVNRRATPAINVVLLLFGAVAANLFGTTGASMLLIRPYLRMNKGHIKPFHIVFFIFLVSNVGGLLTPIGDPPLFLGYLRGVPFWWVAEHCWWAWVLAAGSLLTIFFIFDAIDHGKMQRHHAGDAGPAVYILGIQNLLLIALIVWAVFQPGLFEMAHVIHDKGASPLRLGGLLISREALMLLAAGGSILLTDRSIHERNAFHYGPIREVAILFLGIFSAMTPALQWLNVNAGRLPVKTPGQYYFATGGLSSVLDNAPTYLTFLELRLAKIDSVDVDAAARALASMGESGRLEIDPSLSTPVRRAVETVVHYHGDAVLSRSLTRAQIEVAFLIAEPGFNRFLVAISLSAVLFGACTYIGNGPNFMVRSIAQSAGARPPGFIRYILVYALPILLPVYVLIWLIFLRG